MYRLLTTSVAALLACSAIQAATISHDSSYGPAQTDWDPAQTLSLEQFNPLMGTLNSVTFQFSGTIRSDFTTSNKASKAGTAQSNLDGILRFVLPTLDEAQVTLSATQLTSLAGKATATYSLEDTDTVTLVLDSNLDPFKGTGMFDLGVFALATSAATGTGNIKGFVLSYATASASVTYDYTSVPQPSSPVPEPASMALVGLALAAAGLARRRA